MKIGFSRSLKSPLFSKIIMWFSDSFYSHCYIEHEGKVYHANLDGVNITFYDLFLKSNFIYDEIEINLKGNDEFIVMTRIKELIYTKYSKKNLIGLAFQIIFKLDKNPFKDGERRLTCGEFVYLVLTKLGFTINKEVETITPKDIFTGLILWKNK